jgi:hypothetical protein
MLGVAVGQVRKGGPCRAGKRNQDSDRSHSEVQSCRSAEGRSSGDGCEPRARKDRSVLLSWLLLRASWRVDHVRAAEWATLFCRRQQIMRAAKGRLSIGCTGRHGVDCRRIVLLAGDGSLFPCRHARGILPLDGSVVSRISSCHFSCLLPPLDRIGTDAGSRSESRRRGNAIRGPRGDILTTSVDFSVWSSAV